MDALNWALLNLEDPCSNKIIVTETMQIAMEDQQEIHFSHKSEAESKIDPHIGLKELYTEEQNLLFVRQILHLNRQSSRSLHFCYCWGTNNGVRGVSIRVMTFRDLNMSNGYGPENESEESGRKKTLLLIFCKGKWHKENFKHPKQTGVQRHRDWHHCSVFDTAMSVIMKMKKMESYLTFTHNRWFDIPLTDFTTYQQMGNLFVDVYKDAGIHNPVKITHFRLQCMLYAASRGLTESQISSVTKQITTRITNHYMPEVDIETCKVMSGFSKHECCFVPSEHSFSMTTTMTMCNSVLV
jgi:hypothetical protein